MKSDFVIWKIFARVGLLTLLVGFSLMLVACGATDGLRDQADTMDQVAQVSGAAADRIDAKLDEVQAGTAPADAVSLAALLPMEWRSYYDGLVASGKSAVESFADISARLRTIQTINAAEAQKLRDLADANADAWTNGIAQAQAVATGINPIIGLGVGLATSIVAAFKAFREGQKNGTRNSSEIINVGRHASPEFNNQFQDIAGEAMKKALVTVPKVVRETIEKTKL